MLMNWTLAITFSIVLLGMGLWVIWDLIISWFIESKPEEEEDWEHYYQNYY